MCETLLHNQFYAVMMMMMMAMMVMVMLLLLHTMCVPLLWVLCVSFKLDHKLKLNQTIFGVCARCFFFPSTFCHDLCIRTPCSTFPTCLQFVLRTFFPARKWKHALWMRYWNSYWHFAGSFYPISLVGSFICAFVRLAHLDVLPLTMQMGI